MKIIRLFPKVFLKCVDIYNIRGRTPTKEEPMKANTLMIQAAIETTETSLRIATSKKDKGAMKRLEARLQELKEELQYQKMKEIRAELKIYN